MKNSINPVTYRLALLSGVRRNAILRAPDAINLAATSGVIMLLTAVFAMSTMGYALQRAFVGDRFALPVALCGGVLWGTFILALDRLLLMGIDKTGRWYHTTIQLMIRVPIAVLLGMVISKPLVLRVSRTILDRELREQQMTALAGEKKGFEQEEDISGKTASVAELKKQRATQERRIIMEPDSFEYTEAKGDANAASERYRAVSAANNTRIGNAQRQIRNMEGSRELRDLQRIQTLRESIGRWRSEIARAAEDVQAARQRLLEIRGAWVTAEQAALVRIKAELDAAEKAQGISTGIIVDKTGKSDASLRDLMRTNLVNEYTTFEHIKNTPSHRNSKTLARMELGLDAIFIMFELAPLFSKVFSRTNALDRASSAIELEDDNRITHASNTAFAQSQKQFEIGLTLYEEAVEQWAESMSQSMQQNPIMTVQALRDLREEIARLAA